MRLWQESEVRYAILVAGFGLDEANHIVERLPRANRLLLIDPPASSAGVDLSRRDCDCCLCGCDCGPGEFLFFEGTHA
jgi:hypothetical protein